MIFCAVKSYCITGDGLNSRIPAGDISTVMRKTIAPVGPLQLVYEGV